VSRHAKDSNENFLTCCLLKLGWNIKSTSQVGNGFPDAVVGRDGIIALVEFKLEVQAKPETQLTKPQLHFHSLWPAPIYIIRSEWDCVQLYKVEIQRLIDLVKGASDDSLHRNLS